MAHFVLSAYHRTILLLIDKFSQVKAISLLPWKLVCLYYVMFIYVYSDLIRVEF